MKKIITSCTLDIKKKIFFLSSLVDFNFDGDVRSNKLAALYYSFSHQFERQMPYVRNYKYAFYMFVYVPCQF